MFAGFSKPKGLHPPLEPAILRRDMAAKLKIPRKKPVRRPKPGTERTGVPAVIPGHSAFTVEDFTEKATNSERVLTVSPLRAVMTECEGVEPHEHVVTERTRQGVSLGAGLGMERKVIAMILNLDEETLERLYAKELKTATHLLMSDIQLNLYNIARDPKHVSSVKSGIYLLGRLGNRLFQEQRVASQALAVDPTTRTIDPSLLDDSQRSALRDILMAAMRLAQPGESAGVLVEGDYTETEDYDDAEDVL